MRIINFGERCKRVMRAAAAAAKVLMTLEFVEVIELVNRRTPPRLEGPPASTALAVHGRAATSVLSGEMAPVGRRPAT